MSHHHKSVSSNNEQVSTKRLDPVLLNKMYIRAHNIRRDREDLIKEIDSLMNRKLDKVDFYLVYGVTEDLYEDAETHIATEKVPYWAGNIISDRKKEVLMGRSQKLGLPTE